jgi:hypothetical protein
MLIDAHDFMPAEFDQQTAFAEIQKTIAKVIGYLPPRQLGAPTRTGSLRMPPGRLWC